MKAKFSVLILMCVCVIPISCRQHRTPKSISFKMKNSSDSVYISSQASHQGIENSDTLLEFLLPSSEENNSQLLRRKAYIVSYNKDTKCPNWVVWHLTAEHTDGLHQRSVSFYEEESIPIPRATNEDYKGTGWSRGHMCPAGDNKWDETAMYETFSLANICPQNAKLNSGLWNSIEIDCRRWAKQYGDIYIVCGPVFYKQEHETIGRNEVCVPEAFFKVVLCLNGKPKGLGVVVKNNAGTKKKNLYYNSIDQVERITGIDFFPALPDDMENKVEAQTNLDDWR